ncbi:MAG: PadR family transcriptional regulator [Candidatus Pacebacteria bacterium]|nr:PadR family transcriptional regulator [Candidatus Paceibacterota bacterium]
MDKTDYDKLLENTRIQMRKGILEFAILLIIGKEKSYANDIIRKLQAADLTVVEGTIYPLLSRLKNSGLIDYFWEESKSGPPRKYYTLTKPGEKFLSGCDQQWSTLEAAIHSFK